MKDKDLEQLSYYIELVDTMFFQLLPLLLIFIAAMYATFSLQPFHYLKYCTPSFAVLLARLVIKYI